MSLPIKYQRLGICLFASIITAVLLVSAGLQVYASSLFTPYHGATNQEQPNASHLDYTTNPAHKANLAPALMAGIHVPFIQNVGQSDSKVKFYANTFAGTVFVTDNGLTYSIPDPSGNKDRTFSVVQENLANAKQIDISGIQKSNTTVNYFIGNHKQDWRTKIPTYDGTTLGTVWPGINLSLKAHGNNVEKVFTLNPGSSVQNIKINMEGVKSLAVSDGQLLISTAKGTLSMTKPRAYQDIDGITRTVDVSYTVSGTTYGFDIGSYDRSHPVIIDPLLDSTYISGSGGDHAGGIALDSSGNIYVTGLTFSTNFPTTAGAYQTVFGSKLSIVDGDVFVSKLSFTSSIYAIGGANALLLLNNVEVYNSSTNSWTAVATLPTATADLAAAVDYSGNIYAVGGCSNGHLKTVYKYTSTNSWTVLVSVTGVPCQETNAVYKYAPSANTWTSVATLPVATYDLAAATDSGGNIYAIGGENGPSIVPPTTNAVYKYTPSTNSWTSVATLPTATHVLAAVDAPSIPEFPIAMFTLLIAIIPIVFLRFHIGSTTNC